MATTSGRIESAGHGRPARPNGGREEVTMWRETPGNLGSTSIPQCQTSSDDESEMQSILQEARDLGLCQDYFSLDPFESCNLPTPPEPAEESLADPPDVMTLGLRMTLDALNGTSTREKYDVDGETMHFMGFLSCFERSSASQVCQSELMLPTRTFKAESPIMQGDHDLELLQVRRRNTVVLSSRGLDPFAVVRDKNEDLEWTAAQLALPSEIDQSFACAKLLVDPDAMEFIRNLFEGKTEKEDNHAVIAFDAPRILVPEEPTLMPLSSPNTPSTLPISLREVNLTSSPEDLLAQDAANVDRAIMGADQEFHVLDSSCTLVDDADMSNYAAVQRMLGTAPLSSSPAVKRRKVQDIKVEGPLTPIEFGGSPADRAHGADFSFGLADAIPLPVSDSSIIDLAAVGNDIDELIRGLARPLAGSVNHDIENENLVELDTTMRVQVPRLENVALRPPWSIYNRLDASDITLEVQRMLLAMTKKELLKDEVKWDGVSKLDRLLPWSAFPSHLGKVVREEDFDEDGSSQRYLSVMEYDEEVDLQDYVSKMEGLRILGDQDSDFDELECIEYNIQEPEDVEVPLHVMPERPVLPLQATAVGEAVKPPHHLRMIVSAPISGLDALLRKRKLQLEGEDTGQRKKLSSACASLTIGNTLGSRGDGFLQDRGLIGFMQLHGAKPDQPSTKKADNALSAMPAAVMVAPERIDLVPKQRSRPLLRPPISDANRPVQVVVDSTVLTNRSVIRQLQSLLPELDIIERVAVHRQSATATASELAGDSDLALSPSTGLITTTLQKLKQKPLPGQTSFSGVRDKISRISSRYERLLVLVSQGQQASVHDHVVLDERDSEALADFISFTCSLDCSVEVTYVHGGEDELAHWTAAAISRHGLALQDDATQLLPEETMWERFLRTAGMNAYAAQVVLGKLKVPRSQAGMEGSAMSSQENAVFGLAAFVLMSTRERVRALGDVMGGERVLGRVGAVIDGGWVKR